MTTPTTDRYSALFSRLAERDEGAFVPFLMLGDTTPERTLDVVRAVVAAGADALELGVPFSDPVADGPTIQRSHLRALAAGATVETSLQLVAAIREEFPELPLGMLVYGNVAYSRGVTQFYRDFRAAGADSVLIPDIPVREGQPFVAAATEAGIDPIFIAPANASEETVRGVAALSRGYIYAISRDGVTGTERESTTSGLPAVVANIARFHGAPILLGFGISEPRHVREAIAAGAAGAITGSAITGIIERHADEPERLREELTAFVHEMKAATRPAASGEA